MDKCKMSDTNVLTKIKDFLKYELSGWKKHEIIALSIIFLIVIFNAVVLKDSKVASVSAICGIMYSTIAGKGKISCYIFGLTGTAFYSYLAWKSALYGNLLLYAGYYFPMQVAGIFAWKKHLKKSNMEIEKTQLSDKERLSLTLAVMLLSAGVILCLKYFNDNSPIFDGITTVLSIAGMYLTVKRCIEQWVVWMVVNALSCVMWLVIVMQGTKAYSTLLMWGVYFILAVYFYCQWRAEMKSDN